MRTLKSLGTTAGLFLAALATTGWLAAAHAQAADQAAPAPDTSTAAPADTAPAKPVHHKHAGHKASKPKSEAGDAAVDDLNAKSLEAAKGGKPFTPGSDAPKAAPAKKALKPMHHHHHMKMAAKPADDAAAPAPDATPK